MPVCDLPKYKSELNFLSKLTLSKEIKKYGQGEVTNLSWKLLLKFTQWKVLVHKESSCISTM